MNWTYSGANNNDEVIVIIYSKFLANAYFQEFNKRWIQAGGSSNKNENIAFQEVEVFNVDGRLIGKNISIKKLRKGVYVLKSKNGNYKIIINYP